MTRVSTAEMYDDKDVITQICKLKDGLNSALGGIIADIDIVNDELVIDWADGESIALPLPSPTGISSIAGSVSGGNLTMTIYMTDGSSHAFTCPLNGMASEAYVDAGLATKADITTLDDYALKTYVDNKREIVTFNGTSDITNFLDYIPNMKVGDRIIGTRLRDSAVTGMGIQDFEFTVSRKGPSAIAFMGNAIGIKAVGSVNTNNCYCANITLTLSSMTFTVAYLDTATSTTKYDLVFLGSDIDTLTDVDVIHYN